MDNGDLNHIYKEGLISKLNKKTSALFMKSRASSSSQNSICETVSKNKAGFLVCQEKGNFYGKIVIKHPNGYILDREQETIRKQRQGAKHLLHGYPQGISSDGLAVFDAQGKQWLATSKNNNEIPEGSVLQPLSDNSWSVVSMPSTETLALLRLPLAGTRFKLPEKYKSGAGGGKILWKGGKWVNFKRQTVLWVASKGEWRVATEEEVQEAATTTAASDLGHVDSNVEEEDSTSSNGQAKVGEEEEGVVDAFVNEDNGGLESLLLGMQKMGANDEEEEDTLCLVVDEAAESREIQYNLNTLPAIAVVGEAQAREQQTLQDLQPAVPDLISPYITESPPETTPESPTIHSRKMKSAGRPGKQQHLAPLSIPTPKNNLVGDALVPPSRSVRIGGESNGISAATSSSSDRVGFINVSRPSRRTISTSEMDLDNTPIGQIYGTNSINRVRSVPDMSYSSHARVGSTSAHPSAHRRRRRQSNVAASASTEQQQIPQYQAVNSRATTHGTYPTASVHVNQFPVRQTLPLCYNYPQMPRPVIAPPPPSFNATQQQWLGHQGFYHQIQYSGQPFYCLGADGRLYPYNTWDLHAAQHQRPRSSKRRTVPWE